MSGCPAHGTLIGGYVLGALDPGEMEKMRDHLAACRDCGPEAERLMALPGLLDRIVPADVPPPALSPQVEEEVLDNFARERRAPAGRPRRPTLGGRRLAALATAGLAALVVALALVLPLGGDDGPDAYASVTLGGVAGAPEAWASAELAAVPAGTRIRLRTGGLRAGDAYELWCIRADGRWVSGGTFRADRDGRTEAELTAAVRPGDYHRMAVTRRPRERGPRGATVLRGALSY